MRRHSLRLHRSIGAHPQPGPERGVRGQGSGVRSGRVVPGPWPLPPDPSLRARLLSSRRAGLPLGRLTDLRSLIFAAFLIATRLKLGDRLAWCPVDPTTLLGLAVGTMALW